MGWARKVTVSESLQFNRGIVLAMETLKLRMWHLLREVVLQSCNHTTSLTFRSAL